ncbi:MAG: hypothetical protein HQ567_15790 [Candidatus Nealsonbacteria bacterium]|nr:hypothetical protein [Candidatus Nealsonbacteria bacterium]
MSATYLLPCSCGKTTEVRPHQAGEMLSCPCGATLEVPTVLQMAHLEQVPMEPGSARPSTSWGLRQSMVLIGVLIALLGIGLTVGLFVTRPQLLDTDEVHDLVNAKSAVQSWLSYREDLRIFGPAWHSKKRDAALAEDVFRRNVWMGVTLTLTAGGIILATGATLQGRAARRGALSSDFEQ